MLRQVRLSSRQGLLFVQVHCFEGLINIPIQLIHMSVIPRAVSTSKHSRGWSLFEPKLRLLIKHSSRPLGILFNNHVHYLFLRSIEI